MLFGSLGHQKKKSLPMTGEASPYYIFHPLAAQRIKDTIPQVKLIAMLRDPVDRAYSHYQHSVRLGLETLSFAEAIEKENERLSGEEGKIINNPDYKSFSHRHYTYLTRGLYAGQISRWLDYFPREQILIIKSEDFFGEPGSVIQRVFTFLELPEWTPKRLVTRNITSYDKPNSHLRKKLKDFFEPHNRRLYDITCEDYDWDG